MEGAVIFDVKEEGERERATWRSLIRRRQPFSFCRFPPFLLFCCLRFVILVSVLSFSSVSLFVVSYFSFVVFLLSLIRERRGALLFALNVESAAKVIAADSSHLIVLGLKY